MPRFHYRAMRQSGGEIAGEIVATDAGAAAAALQSAGSYPIEIAPAAAHGRAPARSARRGRRLPLRELVLFTRQAATLLGAGITLDRALTLIAEERRATPRGRLAASLLAAVNRGERLSEAIAAHPAFPRHYAAMLAAGEAQGDLAPALDRLAMLLERNRQVAQSLIGALVYPASVLVVALLSIGFLLGFVVPRFAVLLTSFRHAPPLAMQALLGLSAAVQAWGVPALLVLAAILAFILVRRRDPAFRVGLDRRLLALPVVGPLLVKLETERLTYLLAAMLASGVTLPAAVAAAREAAGNAALRAALAAAERGIERGEPFGAALAASGLLPAMALELVRVGEETGDLAPMLAKASEILRKEIESAASEWIALIAPVSLLLLGLIVGAIALAIFGTLMEAYDIAS